MSILNFQNHLHHKFFDRFPHCPSLAYQNACINFPCKFSIKHKALKAVRASENRQAETPAPATLSSSPWKKWMIVIMFSIILPSFRHKWGPILTLKSKVDMTIETTDSVTEAVEELAEEVEKVADEVANMLPGHTNLKKTVEIVENQAEQDDELVHQDQVEGVEKKLENEVMESNMDQAKMDSPKES